MNSLPLDVCAALADALRARGWRMASAESCTGGLVAASCTSLAGSSDWFERGWVTYSNLAKTTELGVDAELIEAHGAVSEAVARAMATGAVEHAAVDCALSITGVAGPGGGSAAKPVGTVWFGWATTKGVFSERLLLPGDRTAIRVAATRHALDGLLIRL
jgi:nicotinamide-nucleotide amidase